MAAAPGEALDSQSLLRRRRTLAGSAARGMATGLLICLAVFLLNMFAGPNLHVVVPGAIYRSSQVSEDRLDKLVRKLGIRTVINLRGNSDGPWYPEECRATSRLGLSQEDISFSANHLPPVLSIRRLIELIDRSEPPILFHCFRGVDRTGLAVTIALLIKTDTPLPEARRSLGLRYLHLPFARTGHLDRFFEFYESWLSEHDWEHTPQRFRTWATREYRGGACCGRVQVLGMVVDSSETVTPAQPLERTHSGPNSRLRLRVPRGIPFGVRVRCHNDSDETWHFHPYENTGVHAFWRRVSATGMLDLTTRAGRYHADVPPGTSIDLTLPFPPFRESENVHVQVGLIEEKHCFLHEVGLELLDLQLEVP